MITLLPEQCRPGYNYDNLEYHTREVPDYGYDPSRHVVRHMEELLSSDLKRGNATLGTWFEICIIDSLLKYGVEPERVFYQHWVFPKERFNCEIDILVKGEPNTYIQAKTSLRERWKIFDREAMLVRMSDTKSPKNVALMYDEKPGDIKFTIEKNITLATSKADMCQSVDQIITVYDSEKYNKFVRELL